MATWRRGGPSRRWTAGAILAIDCATLASIGGSGAGVRGLQDGRGTSGTGHEQWMRSAPRLVRVLRGLAEKKSRLFKSNAAHPT